MPLHCKHDENPLLLTKNAHELLLASSKRSAKSFNTPCENFNALKTFKRCPCRKPQVGDVVIFHPDFALRSGPSWFNDDVFIKRIVAIAGNTVEVDCHSFPQLILNLKNGNPYE